MIDERTPEEHARAFVQSARALKGARWRHRGRKPWAVDCIGLVALAFKNSGHQFEDQALYPPEPVKDSLRRAAVARWGNAMTVDQARPGDIAGICWGRKDRELTHIAIVGDHPDGGLTLIHATSTTGVVEQSMTGPFLSIVMEVYRPWREGDG